MKRILVLFAHPAFSGSIAQKALLREARALDNITVHDLYEMYPSLHIDASREQDALRSHDVIIFQHPFYWYSSPAILKEWQDIVLEYGFAYGETGTALHGKIMTSVLSTGGPAASYCGGGYNRYSLRQLLTPFEQTAELCGMTYAPPFVICGMASPGAAARAGDAARHYPRYLEALAGPDGVSDTAVPGFEIHDGLVVIPEEAP